MRVGESVAMRADEIDMTGEVWLFNPQKHKTAWRGHKRTIAIGPRGQEIIRRNLKAQTGAVLFSPAEQEAMIAAQKRAARKTKVPPSQENRKKARPKKKPGEQFTRATSTRPSSEPASVLAFRSGIRTNSGIPRPLK
jgi:hypothetical protein